MTAQRAPGALDLSCELAKAAAEAIPYGMAGPSLPEKRCRICWGETYYWLGNTWGLDHVGGSFDGCQHPCHDGEVWIG